MIRLIIIALLSLGLSSPLYAATVEVTTETDEIDAGGAGCSLREAISVLTSGGVTLNQCSNSSGDGFGTDDTITVPAGTYTLSIPSATENFNVDGDLDIRASMTINGAGAGNTFIQAGPDRASGIDRVFHVLNDVTVAINDVTIRHGKTTSTGGGIQVCDDPCALSLSNSVVTDNQADDGGGIDTGTSTTTISNTTISDNDGGVAGTGGGILAASTLFTMTGSTVSNNGAGSGGGVYAEFDAGTKQITNSTISGNTATVDGGGIYFASGTATLSNVTITNNTADQDASGGDGGGGIFLEDNTPNTVTLKNSILAGNKLDTANDDCFKDGVGVLNSGGHNILDAASASCDPSFGSTDLLGQAVATVLNATLADNGGTTQTHALLAGSPAIDAGSSDCPPPATDQRGVTRTAPCDIGAFEIVCGDGQVNGSESCDDSGESATCDADCTAVSCGDGTVNTTAGEECDDGNTVDGDGCSASCTNETTTTGAPATGGGCSLIR